MLSGFDSGPHGHVLLMLLLILFVVASPTLGMLLLMSNDPFVLDLAHALVR